VHKGHITDWIGAHTSLGEALKSYDLERLASQVTGDYVTVAYRIHTNWVGKDGVDKPTTTRIVHSWLRSAGGYGRSCKCARTLDGLSLIDPVVWSSAGRRPHAVIRGAFHPSPATGHRRRLPGIGASN
jgi:hypothetical protein